MSSLETNTNEPVDEPTRPAARFQFSLFQFFAWTTLISTAVGLTGHFGGIEALWMLFGGTIIACILSAAGHIVAEWILAPPEKRMFVLASPWFWLGLGIVFLSMTASAIVEATDSPIDPEKPGPSPGFLLCLAAATAVSLFIGAYRWGLTRRPTSRSDADVRNGTM